MEAKMEKQDKANLAKFRRMIKDSGNELVNLVELEDEVLLKFIRRSHLNLQKSLQRLIHSFEARFSLPFAAIIERGYPSAVRHVFDKQIFGVLKQRDQLGRIVVWFRLNRWDPNEFSEHDLFRAIVMMGWELLASKTTQLKGIVGILDASDCTLAHLKVATIAKMKMYTKLYSQCSPFHNGGGHIMFAPMTFKIGFSVLKPFLPRQIRKLIHVHHGKRSLHEYVPATILPNFFGGVLAEQQATDYAIVDNLLQKDDYYKGLIQLGQKEFYERFPKKKEELQNYLSSLENSI